MRLIGTIDDHGTGDLTQILFLVSLIQVVERLIASMFTFEKYGGWAECIYSVLIMNSRKSIKMKHQRQQLK